MSLILFEGFEDCGTLTGFANRVTSRVFIKRLFASYDDADPGHAFNRSTFIIDGESQGYALDMGVSGLDTYGTMLMPAQTVGDGSTSYTWGARVHIPNGTRTSYFLFFRDSSNNIIGGLRFINSTDLTIIRSNFGNVVATATAAVSPGAWHYIELKIKFSDANGEWDLKVDGVTVATGTGQTANTGQVTDHIVFWKDGGQTSTSTNDNLAFDDVYLVLNDGVTPENFLYPVRAVRVNIDGDASPNDWNKSSGSVGFSLLEENGADDADYVESATNAEVELFTVETPVDTGAVYGVKVAATTFNTSGSAPVIKVLVNSNGSESGTNGTVDDLVNYELFTHYAGVDPDTSAQWVNADLVDLKVGIEIVSGF